MRSAADPLVNPRLYEVDYHAKIAIPALKRLANYLESFSDENEQYKASFDSLGSLNGIPCFIEVKLEVGSREISHIGEKLREGFQVFGDPENQSVFANKMREVCANGKTPLFGVIAVAYSDSWLPRLVALLHAESERLQFAWIIWRCSVGGELSIVDQDTRKTGLFREQLSLPKVVNKIAIVRKKLPENDYHAGKAAQNGAGKLFDDAVEQFKKAGTNFTSRSHYLSGRLYGVNFRIHGDDSDHESGLLLGINRELEETIRGLGFQIAGYGHFGFPNFRVSGSDGIRSLIRALADRAGEPQP